MKKTNIIGIQEVRKRVREKVLTTKTREVSRIYIVRFLSQVKYLKLCEQQYEVLSTKKTGCDQYF